MNMSSSFERFRQAVEKAGIEGQFSTIESKQLEQVTGSLFLSPELLDWYLTAAPINLYIPWHGDELLLYSPLELTTCQEGYRWETGHMGKLHPYWNANWVVIGDIGADPIIAHTDKEGTSISIAIHGIGKWEPQVVALSLPTFLDVLSAWVQIAGRYRGEISGEDGALLPSVISELRTALSTLLTQEHADNFLSFII